MTLLIGCCAERVSPDVWLVMTTDSERGSSAPNSFLHHLRVEPTRGADLRDLLEEIHRAVDKDRNPRREPIDGYAPRADSAHQMADLDEAKRHLLDGIQAAFAEEISVLDIGVKARRFTALYSMVSTERRLSRLTGMPHE